MDEFEEAYQKAKDIDIGLFVTPIFLEERRKVQ